jgi:nucleotide-binding universal stress UspA family protein
VTGVSRFLYPPGFAYAGEGMAPQLEKHLDELRQRASAALASFSTAASAAGVRSFEAREIEDEAGEGISAQSRYSDLVVIGQTDPEAPSPAVLPDFPEFVIMHTGRPVLLVPYVGVSKTFNRRILVGWDASIHAARAVAGALPLLRRAESVDLVVFNPNARLDAHGEQPGADIGLYLARHGVGVNVVRKRTKGDIGNALLSTAGDLGAGMIVMGGYGHSRFREILLGGATRTVLTSMTVPILMTH